MTRYEPEFFVDLQHITLVINDAMLIGTFDIFDIVTTEYIGQSTVYRLSLEPSDTDGLIALGMAHDGCQDEQ